MPERLREREAGRRKEGDIVRGATLAPAHTGNFSSAERVKWKALPRGSNLEDGGGRGAAQATGGVERVNAEQLVDEAAGDAEHGGAAVLALG
eukprot:scaffold124836_cov52-Phaeocystis_antarctica.AAC.2